MDMINFKLASYLIFRDQLYTVMTDLKIRHNEIPQLKMTKMSVKYMEQILGGNITNIHFLKEMSGRKICLHV